MKRVLMVAYEFPPLGTGGVLRCTKYVKYLRDFGWEPVVLTIDESADPGGVRNYSLLDELPPGIEIHRTPCLDFDALFEKEVHQSKLLRIYQYIDSHFPALFGFAKPDKQITWFPPALEKARQILDKEKIDVVYTDSPPNSTSLVGFCLKDTYGIPWVADFRDPWSLDELAYESMGQKFHKRARELDALLEKIILSKCDQTMVVSEKLRQRYLHLLDLHESQIIVIPDGYDEEDYKDIPCASDNEKDFFNIKYTGSFYGSYNPAIFLHALHRLITRHHIKDIRFHVIGHGSGWVKQNLGELGLTGLQPFIRLQDHMDLKDCLSETMNSDLLLVVSPPDMDYNVPQKIYSYMRTGVPILAVMPGHGETARIIRDHNAGYVVDPSNGAEIENRLCELYLAWKEGFFVQKPDSERLKHLEKKCLTERLVRLFNDVLKLRDQKIQDFNHRGEDCYEEGRYEEALQAFEAALDLNPRCPETLNNIGVMLFLSNACDRALQFFERAIEIEPVHKDALVNLYRASLALGKKKEAYEILGRVQGLYEGEDLEGVIGHAPNA